MDLRGARCLAQWSLWLVEPATQAALERHVLPHDPMNAWFVSRNGKGV